MLRLLCLTNSTKLVLAIRQLKLTQRQLLEAHRHTVHYGVSGLRLLKELLDGRQFIWREALTLETQRWYRRPH